MFFFTVTLAMVIVAVGASVNPIGSTGCSKKWDNGRCWRYCAGSLGNWCYTAIGCNKDNIENNEWCAAKKECFGIDCLGASNGCVISCFDNTVPASKYYSNKPLGSTGCSDGTDCWRFCEGSFGNWCYTINNCSNNNTEVCADSEECWGDGNYTCEADDDYGCVGSCPLRVNGSSDANSNFIYWLQIIGPIIAIVILLFVSFILWKNLYLAKRQLRNMSRAEEAEWRTGCPEKAQNYTQLQNVAMYLPFNNEYEIPKGQLQICDDLLGSGAYGSVYKGYLQNKGGIIVAIKTVNSYAEFSYFKALLDEIKMMIFIGNHQNVLNLLGACTENIRKKEVYVVLEFCENGDLLNFLRKYKSKFNNLVSGSGKLQSSSEYKNLTSSEYNNISNISLSTIELVRFTKEALDGAEYLASKKIIHGDLAARNLLLTKDLTIKIADFGLARQLVLNDEYIKKSDQKIPFRWMAIEVLLERKYSTQSDVWSFGITMWEIFTLGEIPFPGLNCDRAFITMLENGFRPHRPPAATSEIYEFMVQCWHPEPNQRMSFTELKNSFQEIINPENQTKIEARQDGPIANYNYYTDINVS